MKTTQSFEQTTSYVGESDTVKINVSILNNEFRALYVHSYGAGAGVAGVYSLDAAKELRDLLTEAIDEIELADAKKELDDES